MTNRNNDRSLIYIAVASLIAIAVLFVGYSYTTSNNMDRSAATAGSATNSQSPNTVQDKAGDKPAGAQTTGANTNVPPASAPNR